MSFDQVEYRRPDGRVCELRSGDRVYVIVYDTFDHRLQAFNGGEASFNLCGFTRATNHASRSWSSLVAGNWRAATPASGRTLSGLDQAFGGAPERESLSCQFRT